MHSQCRRKVVSGRRRSPELFTVSFIGRRPRRAFCPAVCLDFSRWLLPPVPQVLHFAHAGACGEMAKEEAAKEKIMLREKVFWLDSKMGDTSRSSSSPCVCVLVGTRLVCWPCLRVLGAHLIRRSCLGVVPAFVQLSKSPAPRVTSLLATIWPPRKPFSGLTT